MTNDPSSIAILPTSQNEPKSNLDKFLRVYKRVSPLIWGTVVCVVVIPLIGQWFMARSFADTTPTTSPVEISVPSQPAQSNQTSLQPVEPDWAKIESVAKEKLHSARTTTEAYARDELDQWVETLTDRVDTSFLDWYFGYFHQKELEYQSFFTAISGKWEQWLDPQNPSPEEKIAEAITAEFQEEFAKRVLVPQISEFRLKNIATQTAKKYIYTLGEEFNQIPVKSGISAADWNRYLNEISIQIPDTVGNPLDLPLKQITAAGSYVVLKPMIIPLLPKVGSAVAAKLAGGVGAGIAAKTGGLLAAKLGGSLLDACVGVGILYWDIRSTQHTANIEKPILHDNLIAYLDEVEESVLSNSENGVMTAVDKIDQKILQSIHITRDLDVSFTDSNKWAVEV